MKSYYMYILTYFFQRHVSMSLRLPEVDASFDNIPGINGNFDLTDVSTQDPEPVEHVNFIGNPSPEYNDAHYKSHDVMVIVSDPFDDIGKSIVLSRFDDDENCQYQDTISIEVMNRDILTNRKQIRTTIDLILRYRLSSVSITDYDGSPLNGRAYTGIWRGVTDIHNVWFAKEGQWLYYAAVVRYNIDDHPSKRQRTSEQAFIQQVLPAYDSWTFEMKPFTSDDPNGQDLMPVMSSKRESMDIYNDDGDYLVLDVPTRNESTGDTELVEQEGAVFRIGKALEETMETLVSVYVDMKVLPTLD